MDSGGTLMPPLARGSGARNPETATPNESSLLDMLGVNALISALGRRIYAFGFITLAVALAAFALLASGKREYLAAASITIEPGGSANWGNYIADAPIESQVIELNSTAIAEKVVDELGLVRDPEFNRALRKRQAEGVLEPAMTPRAAAAERDEVVRAVLKKLAAARVGRTHVIGVGFYSESPQKAARIANVFTEKFIAAQADAKIAARQRLGGWLGEQVASLEREVRDAEDAAEAYRSQAGLLRVNGASLPERGLDALEGQLTIQRAEYATLQSRLVQARRQIAADPSGETIADSDALEALRLQETAVLRRLAELRVNYGPEWPEVMLKENELQEIRGELARQGRRIIQRMEQEAEAAGQRVAALEQRIQTARADLSEENAALVKMRELERRAQIAREQYEEAQRRFRETAAQNPESAVPDARVTERAKEPHKPAKPNRTFAAIVGLLTGLAAGLVAIALLELFDVGLRTPKSLEHHTGLRAIAVTPVIASRNVSFGDRIAGFLGDLFRKDTGIGGGPLQGWRLKLRARMSRGGDVPQDYVVTNPLSPFAESMRALRGAVQIAVGDSACPCVMLTSSVEHEGKTFTSLSFARTAAGSGYRVLLIDADFARGGLTRLMGLAPVRGVEDVFGGRAEPAEAILRDDRGLIDVLAVTGAGSDQRAFLETPRARQVLERLKGQYDLIVFDGPPVLPVAASRLLAARMDAVVLLVRWRQTGREMVQAAVDALRDARAPVIGAALTQVDIDSPRLCADSGMSDYYKHYGAYHSK